MSTTLSGQWLRASSWHHQMNWNKKPNESSNCTVNMLCYPKWKLFRLNCSSNIVFKECINLFSSYAWNWLMLKYSHSSSRLSILRNWKLFKLKIQNLMRGVFCSKGVSNFPGHSFIIIKAVCTWVDIVQRKLAICIVLTFKSWLNINNRNCACKQITIVIQTAPCVYVSYHFEMNLKNIHLYHL